MPTTLRQLTPPACPALLPAVQQQPPAVAVVKQVVDQGVSDLLGAAGLQQYVQQYAEAQSGEACSKVPEHPAASQATPCPPCKPQ